MRTENPDLRVERAEMRPELADWRPERVVYPCLPVQQRWDFCASKIRKEGFTLALEKMYSLTATHKIEGNADCP